MIIKLRKNVPLPPKRAGERQNGADVIRERINALEVNQSLLISTTPGERAKLIRKVQSRVSYLHKKTPLKYAVRRFPSSVGVWRVA